MKAKILSILLFFIIGSTFYGCSQGDSSVEGGNQKFELTLVGNDSENVPSTKNMRWLASEIEKRTDGNVVVKVYPANQVGDGRLQYEGLMDGSIDMMQGWQDVTYNTVFSVPQIPYLTDDVKQLDYILSEDSNIYELFYKANAEIGVKFMGFFLHGLVGMFSAQDLGNYKDPMEKKTMLIRIPTSDVYRLGVQALGYPNMVTIPWADAYTSMQTGVFDGMVGIPPHLVALSFGDITKYYVAIDMYLEVNSFLISQISYDKLPEEYRKIIEDIFKESSLASIKNVLIEQEKGMQSLRDLGVTILPLTDEERKEIAKIVVADAHPKLNDMFGADIMTLVREDMEKSREQQ